MSEKGRRRFIKQGLLGITGAAMLPRELKPLSKEGKKVPGKSSFPSRVLGRTGLELPVVSMGVMNADNPDLVRAAIDAGTSRTLNSSSCMMIS